MNNSNNINNNNNAFLCKPVGFNDQPVRKSYGPKCKLGQILLGRIRNAIYSRFHQRLGHQIAQ